ncbi:hypothetical protein CFC21_107525 [Triticum aestivum]|uniref:KIB1-4 beta-propeller domain-containing protein n=2 Tax=Triticum aestivum TaxID=4565 RepID=A0A9R1MH29_WHEAT|nr:uncharacterized protein LOC123169636 [Triticum aestivum]KAF7106818.1 hypothetical protein CFC21_107525 [Triticum aestivum]
MEERAEEIDLSKPRLRAMGKKLPPSTPTAGRRRKGPSLVPLSACKRRRTPEASGWASLPTDVVHLVTSRLLAGDVVDYIVFRAVCSGWRSCTSDARDPTLSRPDLWLRGWVALCDGDGVRPDDAGEIGFFHTRTARRLRVRLPELRRHRIIGLTQGLIILLNKRTAAVRVLHPFTRVVVDLLSLVPVFHDAVRNRNSVLDMNAAVCSASATSIAVVAWFPWTHVLIGAEAGRPTWEVLHRGLFLKSILPFQGRLYATVAMGGSRKIMQLYPRSPHPVLARVPNDFGDQGLCGYFLVESGGQVLLAVHHLTAQHCGAEPFQQHAYKLFALDIDRGELIPVNCLGGHALFLSRDRSLSVSARDLPSVNSNSIYFSLHRDPVVVHSVRTGFSERLAVSCQIHDGKDRIRPSVRPFTIADHLLTYCHPHEWTKGLMFHEYHSIPESFEELRKNIKAKDSKLRIPRVAVC